MDNLFNRNKFQFTNAITLYKNFSLTIFLVASLTFSGCRKIWDYFEDHHNPTVNCRIEEIRFNVETQDGETQSGNASFSYDNNGNPTLVNIYDPSDGWPKDKGFRCDNDNRLIVYVDDMFITTWHKYTYVNPSTIIDSAFIYSSGDYTVTDRPDTYVEVRVSKLTLDAWGRIIKEESDLFGVTTYRYDFNGNLTRPVVTYTNKLNIRQTNKVWQLIDRDYSIHQPAGEVETFNSYNLPYQFKNEIPVPGLLSTFSIYPGAVVSYRCE